jgi:hypothetical protein
MLAQVCGHGKHAGEKPANAEFIVRACNSYADLLAALRAADERLDELGDSPEGYRRAVVRAAIAKATEGAVTE